VTGRPRRCGWLDLPLLRYSNEINGTEWLVVTKMDVLDSFAEIPICTGYRIDGKSTDTIPADVSGLEKIEPVYTKLEGWETSTEGTTEFDRLPKAAQKYFVSLKRSRAPASAWSPPARTGSRPWFCPGSRQPWTGCTPTDRID